MGSNLDCLDRQLDYARWLASQQQNIAYLDLQRRNTLQGFVDQNPRFGSNQYQNTGQKAVPVFNKKLLLLEN